MMSSRLIDAFGKLVEREQHLLAGDTLFRAGDTVQSLYLVVRGELVLSRVLPHGPELIFQHARAGDILAVASLFADHYHCDAVAARASILSVLPMRRVAAALVENFSLLLDWARHLAREVHYARAQAEILSLKTVAERIDAWRALNGGTLPPKGRWRQLAAEIGVSPEALYRELARRSGGRPIHPAPVNSRVATIVVAKQ